MSRRLPTFQVRAATTSIGRQTTRYRFHSLSMEEQHTIAGVSSSNGGDATAREASGGVPVVTNNSAKTTPPLTTAKQPSANSASTSSPFSSNNNAPMTPITPTNANRLWNPSRGIIFAPSPITPVSPFTTPLSRGFQTRTSSKSPLDTPTTSPDSPSDILESPTVRKIAVPRKRFSRGPDWAGLMNLTPDGKEKVTVPAGFGTLQEDILADSTEDPLGEVKDLQDAIEAVAEDAEGEVTAPLEEDGEEQYEDPGIERVKTPEGIIKIMWKKKPLVYNEDEKDPYVPLAYQAKEEVLQAAIEAKEKFDMKHYVNAEGLQPTIHYVTDVDEMETVSKLFENDKAIGFDMEWVPNMPLRPAPSDRDIRNCTSVIQIANPERVAIFHLAKFPAGTKNFIAPTFKKILEDPDVAKTGVCIKADMSRLSMMTTVSPAGILELSDFDSWVFAAEGNVGKSPFVTLTYLCEKHLKLPLNKGDVRTSNWSKPLNDEQKIYAANDAYASFRIYDALEQRRCALDPRPALPPRHTVNYNETIEAYNKRRAMAKKDDGTPKKPTVIRVPKDAGPQLVQAYNWVKDYAKSKSDGVLATGAANLRCYALWHHQSLDVEDTAAACRDPPLGTAYVAQCILEAVLVEKLPYKSERLLWVMRDVSKEAMGRFYALRSEAAMKMREEQAAAAKAREAMEQSGWNMGDAESSGQAGRGLRRSNSWPLRSTKPPDEAFATRFERKLKKGEGKPEIRFHQSDSPREQQPIKPLVRAVVIDSKETTRNLDRRPFGFTATTGRKTSKPEAGDTSGDPMQSSHSRTAELTSTISFDTSGELGEAVEGFSETGKVRYRTEDDATPLRESKSEPNLVPKRPVWIGVPSRRRKNDL
ncbi:hypothetical protein TWF281_000297 [Arthrobotrys megalospora]